ncbi:conserved hypothetical protein [Photobacterium profundum SS9]|uniref:CDP-glycerol--glycerophosphate glycerophosphotransferase n=2 Tax=Photobacterium profundum TaxID=74109 RepID=Q6LVM4_PHOPR|nr:conserved hypothetical protein [Photobacterium profundum SS9]
MNQQKKRYLMYIAQNYSYAILRPLQALIRSKGGDVCWFLEGEEVSGKFLAKDENHLANIADVIAWQPDVVFVPGNVVPNFIPGLKVAVFHGFNSGKLNRKGREDHFEIRGCFDLFCTQGPDTTERFEHLAQQYKFFNVKQTGWPMLDPLFHPQIENPYINEKDDRATVLMCSTFSRNLTCAPHLFEHIKTLSQTGRWRWLVQFHPKMDPQIVEMYKGLESENLTFIETDNVIPVLQAADVMLCDTSSVLLMHLLQRKPVVTFKNQSPKPHLINITDAGDVESALEIALSRPESLMAEIEAYCQLIHPYTDGCSSLRVFDAANEMVSIGYQGLKPKPYNWLRQYKMRKKLGYWKF